MDVHPPHEPVHSWRDALTHLAIVTVGLFIALMLEAVVEYVHHRHLVHEARENIRQEMEDNHKAAQQDIVAVQGDSDRITAAIRTLQQMQAGVKGQHSLDFHISFNNPSDAAWSSARDTGALSYMPYKEVQAYADLYNLQGIVNTQAIKILQVEAENFAPIIVAQDDTKFSPGQYQAMLQGSAVTVTDLYILKQELQQLDQQYLTTLKDR